MCKRIFKEQTSPVGDIPFYKIGTFGAEPDAFISRELFEEYKEKFQYPKIGDMLISASGTIGRTVEYDGEEAYFQDSNIVWFKHDERVDNSFLKCIYGIIKWSGIEGSTIKRLYNDNFLKTEFYMPSVAEQEKIGEYFANLDHLITLHQRKYDDTKLLKKYMLQKMFPQNGQKVPEIRFSGFTGDWEQRKLGELYQRNTERNENLIGYDKTISVATMSYKDDGNGASESSLSTYKVIRVGDIAFEGHTNKQFRFGRFVVNDIGTGIMSPRFSTLRPLNEMPVNFWKQYIHSESVMRRILVNSTKAGTMMNELVIPEFLNQTIMVPSENEQAVIGQYFTNIDHLITLHQRKCDEVKSLKKYMLQKMFPQNEQKVPEIRFKGFTEAWEQRKLGDIASSFEYGLNAAAKEYDGENKYIRITDIDDNTHKFLTDNLTSPDIDLTGADNYKLTEGDILFARTGASVGKTYIYRNSDGLVYYAGFLIRARIKEEYDAEFVFQNTLTDRYNKYIAVTSQRSGQPGVNAQEYAEFEINVPKKEEQTKIGTYFRNIDHLITLHQQKCEELKKIKKFMLQKMFV